MEVGDFTQFGTTQYYWNPLAYVKAYGTSYVNVWSPAFGFKIKADAIPYQFTFFNFDGGYSWADHFCGSLGYQQEVFDFDVMLSLGFEECSFGLIGMMREFGWIGTKTSGQIGGCKYKVYDNVVPWISQRYKQNWDFVRHWINWTCNYSEPV